MTSHIEPVELSEAISLPRLANVEVFDGAGLGDAAVLTIGAISKVIQADRAKRIPGPTPQHEFAIVIDRVYDGEGPSLAIWNGANHQFSDGDCYERESDGTLDGYTAEWLTHHELEKRLFTKRIAGPVLTDDEIYAIGGSFQTIDDDPDEFQDIACAIEAAVLAKLNKEVE